MKKRHKPKPQRKAPRSAKPVQSAPVRAKSGASAAKRPVAAHVAARRDIAERPSGLWYASFSQPAQRSTTRSLAYSTVKARGAAVATAFEGDDPVYLGLLLLPVVLLAGMLAAGQSLRMPSRIMMPVVASLPSLSRPTPAPVAVSTARPVDVASLTQLPRLSLPTRAPTADVQPWSEISSRTYSSVAPTLSSLGRTFTPPKLSYAPVAPVAVAPWDVIRPNQRLASLAPPALQPIPIPNPLALPAPVALTLPASPDIAALPNIGLCRPAARVASLAQPAIGFETSPEDFGRRLAAAAKAQLGQFTIYSARYRSIKFPGGDVPDLYGACSDLVIRAYRRVGIDLQLLVAQARIGGGDTNIAHRRTDSLRLLFTQNGATLAVSEFPEDYKPGDVVTYYRPFSRVSRAHIAIVSDVMGPNRRPMIIHNRGWGPQLEDALFVDRITGHYRFQGPARPVSPTLVASARPNSIKPARGGTASMLVNRSRSTF